LATTGLMKRFGAVRAIDDVSLNVAAGEVHALISPNGAGKTTLLGLLTGELRPDAGAIAFDGADITGTPTHRRARMGLARSFQITSIFPDMTTLQNAAIAVQVQQGHSFRFWRDARRDPDLTGPAGALLERVGLAGRAEVPAADLSHGEHRQLEIAMALAGTPRLLLLDEPMAGMGAEESQRMVALLRSLRGKLTLLLVEHDMHAVFTLADRISVLSYGSVIASGVPDHIRADPEVQRAYLGEPRGDP
jgi:branched-chain amino acid transport system ATP-binding protein